MQLVQTIPLIWKQKINDSKITAESNHVQNHDIRQNHRDRNIFSVTTIIRQYTRFPKVIRQSFSE